MKSLDEIQRAHDILHSQLTDETPFVFDESERRFVGAALDTLCWILDHTHSTGFATSLSKIEDELQRRGYQLIRLAVPTSDAERESIPEN